jgi:hypothetical protein
LELNNPFLPAKNTGKISLKGYVKKDSYQKVRVIPTKFLRYWELNQESEADSDEQVASMFVGFMEEIRPNTIKAFTPMVLLDEERFEINGTYLHLFLFLILKNFLLKILNFYSNN